MKNSAMSRKSERSAQPSARNKSRRDKPRASSSKRKSTTPAPVFARPEAKPARQHLPIFREAAQAAGEKADEKNCTACGLCCSYVAIEIDGPATVKQATQLLWYVYHEGVSLYVNDEEWMVQFDTTCVHLQPDYRCGIYDTRPHICREFSEQDCEVNTGDDGKTFFTAGEFMDYLKESRPRIHGFLAKNFAPPPETPRTRLTPFEFRFRAVMARRQSLGAC